MEYFLHETDFLYMSLSWAASYYSAIYRNKEGSQGTLEAETDEARSKDLKMQVTANKEIISIEMFTTNLDLARDRQIRRKTWKHYNRWNEQGSNLHLDAAPIALPRQDQALNYWAIRIYKKEMLQGQWLSCWLE